MKKSIKIPALFLAPAMILMFIFLILPIFASLYISLTDFNIYSLMDWTQAEFVGLENYVKLFNDEVFWKSLKNTLYFAVVGVPLAIFFALSFAVMMNKKDVKGKEFFRAGFYLPSITNTVAVAVIWGFILNPNYGFLNWILSFFGFEPINWLGNTTWAMPSIILFVVWKGLGHNIILFLAGLQNIPAHLYEAARIDGASKWQMFKNITLPMLKPTTFFVTVMTVIGYLQLFAEPYMLTEGGPLDSTLSVVLYMYRNGFKHFELGYASAIGYILFILIFVVTLIQMKFRREQ
jgi:multiple sugar transport system permease protein